MLMEPPATSWDLNWKMFGVPVRVHPLFWLVMLILGESTLRQGPLYLLIWVLCVFVSILVHEFGHVFMGMQFGARGRIVLYGFGGLAVGSNRLPQATQRIAVSLAGPGAQFLFLMIIFGLLILRNSADVAYLELIAETFGLPWIDQRHLARLRELTATRPLEVAAVDDLVFINLVWGLLNLLPIWPLDGGQVCRELCEMTDRRKGLEISLVISMATAGILALASLLAYLGRPIISLPIGSLWSALFFGLFAYQSYQAYAQVKSNRWRDDGWR